VVRAAAVAAASLGADCEAPVGEPSLIEELRVLALTSSPCSPVAREGSQLAVAVADPEGVSPELALWTCPDDGGPCWFGRPQLFEGIARAPVVTTSSGYAWAVACAPGVCDLDALTEDDLREPEAWLATLPMAGVSAGATYLIVEETRSTHPVCVNPALRSQPNRDQIALVSPGEEVVLQFEVAGAGVAYAWTTAGRFEAVEYGIPADSSLALRWTAPDEPADAALFVVFVETAETPYGAVLPTPGNAVWSGVSSVQQAQ
jgi:hypothetical protein